jgi:hypothetical protein
VNFEGDMHDAFGIRMKEILASWLRLLGAMSSLPDWKGRRFRQSRGSEGIRAGSEEQHRAL